MLATLHNIDEKSSRMGLCFCLGVLSISFNGTLFLIRTHTCHRANPAKERGSVLIFSQSNSVRRNSTATLPPEGWLVIMTVIPLHKSNIVLPRTGNPIVGLIAALNPVIALVSTVISLLENGASWVVVVNDGSDDPESLHVFDKVAKIAQTTVINLPKNSGKSAALRAGYLALPPDPRIVIMQTDDDTAAGMLRYPLRLIRRGRAHIVDIRIETFDGNNLIGLVQQLDYWLINALRSNGSKIGYGHGSGYPARL